MEFSKALGEVVTEIRNTDPTELKQRLKEREGIGFAKTVDDLKASIEDFLENAPDSEVFVIDSMSMVAND